MTHALPSGSIPPGRPTRIRQVSSFAELARTPLADGINALGWPRTLPGDFGEIVRLLGPGEGIVGIDDAQLLALPVSAAGRVAVETILADLRQLRALDLAPELNCIHSDIRDEDPGPVPIDVYSFHADSATIEADTWLCTYHGATSEGLHNEEAVRKVDIPEIRAELLRLHGGADDDSFREFLSDHCYDLHYAPLASARPFAFGVGHLWRIALAHPGSCVPPCIHRAPPTPPGQPRLLLLS